MPSSTQTEVPEPMSVLPQAILERPSLEAAESFEYDKRVDLQVKTMDNLALNDANRRVAFKP